jgi:hypothetical protein
MGVHSEEAIQFFDPIFRKIGYEPEYIVDDLTFANMYRFGKNIDVIICIHQDSMLSNYGQFQFTEPYDSIEIHKMNIEYFEIYECYKPYYGILANHKKFRPTINSTTHPYNSYMSYLNNTTIQANNVNDLIKMTIINPNAGEIEEIGARIQVVGPKASINEMFKKEVSKKHTISFEELKNRVGDKNLKKPDDDFISYTREVVVKSDEILGNQPLIAAVNKNSPVSVYKINRGINNGIREGRLLQIKENLSYELEIDHPIQRNWNPII